MSNEPARRTLRARLRLLDVVVVGVAALPVLALLVGSEDPAPLVLGFDLAVTLVAASALWWRHRWLVPVFVVITLAAALAPTVFMAQTVILFAVAVRRRARDLAPFVALYLLAVVVQRLLREPDPDMQIGGAGLDVLDVLAELGGALLVVGLGQLWRLRRWYRQQKVERREAGEQQRVEQIRRLERTRIAREMHDVLAHRISLISMHANALEYRADAAGDEIAQSASVIRSGAHQALEDLREVIGVLRADTGDPAQDRPQPELGDIPALVEESQQTGTRVSLSLPSALPAADGLTLSVRRTAYRIVQEGLTNARKHAPGTVVTVALSGEPGNGLSVQVTNRKLVGPEPGSGAVPGGGRGIPGAGVGLIGLAERTELAGGRLEHGRTPGGDFRLGAWLPWPT